MAHCNTGLSLTSKLLRFQSYLIAWNAEIEKVFLMISIAPKNGNVLQFLWINDINSCDPEIVVLRFTSVVFGFI